jgi:hypothetical protein
VVVGSEVAMAEVSSEDVTGSTDSVVDMSDSSLVEADVVSGS